MSSKTIFIKSGVGLLLLVAAGLLSMTVSAEVIDRSDIDRFDLAEMSIFYKCNSREFSVKILNSSKAAELKADRFAVGDLKKNPSIECEADGALWKLSIITRLPTASSGYCAGAQAGSLSISRNGTDVVKGQLINYCIGWGLDAFRVGYGSITVCGVGDMQAEAEGKLYGCVSYDKEQFLKKNLRIVDSPTALSN